LRTHGKPPDDESMRASDVRFFWVDGEGKAEDGSYHWSVDCPWVTIALWYGGRLVTSEAPPPGAADTAAARETLETHLQGPAWDPGAVYAPTDGAEQERGLCIVCRQYYPRAEARYLPADQEPCEKCGCSREMHVLSRRVFDKGCVMAWPDVFLDGDGEVEQIGLVHCPCDGYAPPPAGRPATSPELLACHSTSGGERDVRVVLRPTSLGASPDAGDSG
jgi:hypothetical protein